MGNAQDRAQNKFDETGGKVKETAGKVTGNSEMEGEGKGDQLKAQAKDAMENTKEKAGDAVDKVKGMFKSGKNDADR
ncbi:CsbD family protein [Actinomadura hibisca]|uniref:CsbD family protein n=1 Tax=Actinomadura hibisca TaxID=68565 RepID=UPI00083298D3|nr:CsbD family protein [Actinomadura hibisca]